MLLCCALAVGLYKGQRHLLNAVKDGIEKEKRILKERKRGYLAQTLRNVILQEKREKNIRIEGDGYGYMSSPGGISP